MSEQTSENTSVFSLAYLSSICVAKHKLPTDTLPRHLQQTNANILQVLETNSVVTAHVQLFREFTLHQTDPCLHPQYVFEYPLDDSYAEVTNLTNGITAVVCNEFSELALQFLTTSNISISNILDFISDVAGETLLIPEISNISFTTKTYMPTPNTIYCIQHEYIGYLSNLRSILNQFKSKNFCCLMHYSEKMYFENISLLCTHVSPDFYTTQQYLTALEE